MEKHIEKTDIDIFTLLNVIQTDHRVRLEYKILQ